MTPPSGPALGLDIGGTSIKAAALEPDGSALTARSDAYARPSPDELRQALLSVIRRLRDVGARIGLIRAVGLCAPGLYDPESRTIVRSVNIPALQGLRLPDLVRDAVDPRLPEPRVVTDAYAAAIDYRLGLASPIEGRLLAISLGTGVGGCVLDDPASPTDLPRALHVSGTSPGHLGQVELAIAEPDGSIPAGPEGVPGVVEAYLGLPALVRRFGTDPAELSRRLAAMTEADLPFRALVRLLRIAHAIYRPQHIALLGGVGMMLAPALPRAHAAVSQSLTSVARPGWTLSPGRNSYHAALGAARLARN